MDKKEKYNLMLPEPLMARFNAIAEKLVGSRQKWEVQAAAMLAFARLAEQEQRKLVQEIAAAERSEAGIGGLLEIELDIAPSGAKSHPQSAAAASPAAPAQGKGKPREASRSR